MARLPYPDADQVAEVMRALPQPLQHTNIGRMLSHAPALVPPYYGFSAALLARLELDPQLRELCILRVAQRTEARYAWTQHLALADAVLESPTVPDTLLDQMKMVFSPRELVELLLLVGWYWAVGRFMTTLGLEVDQALGTQALRMLDEAS
jgi:alkylhydroperoxidase family enzyme